MKVQNTRFRLPLLLLSFALPLALGACLDRVETPEERAIDRFLDAAQRGQGETLSQLLSPSLRVTAMGRLLSSGPTEKNWEELLRDADLRYGRGSRPALRFQSERYLRISRASGHFQFSANESVHSLRESTWTLEVRYGYPARVFAGRDSVDAVRLKVVRGRFTQAGCTLDLVAAGECDDSAREELRISEIEILDPCLAPSVGFNDHHDAETACRAN
jgi:hypothetical protein